MDTTAPIACRITINNDSLYTNDKFVSLDIYAEDANDMQVWISNDGVIGTITNFELGSTVTITDSDYVIGTVLDSTNSTTTSNSDNVMRIVNWPVEDGNGARTVRVVFNDARGNKTPVDAYDTITITYDLNGNTGTTPQSVETLPGLNVYIPEIPSTGCSVFVGWSTSSTASIANYYADTPVSFDEDITLYAVFEETHSFEDGKCTLCGVAMEINVSFDAINYEWETGDQIRLARWTGDFLDDYYFTVEVAEDSMVTWTPDKTLYWNGTDKHTLAVSYPNMNLIYDNFGIPGDQSTLEKLREADCMNAIWTGNPTTDLINFNLKHRLAKVTVNYEVAEGVTVSKAEIYTFTQYMFFDIDTLERRNVAWEEGDDFWINSYLDDNQFTAFVSPDAYAKDSDFIKITLDDGTVLEIKMNNAVTFAEGGKYNYNVIITADSAYIISE